MTKRTRREFLKQGMLTAGAVALGSVLPIQAAAQEKKEWVEGYVHLVFDYQGCWGSLDYWSHLWHSHDDHEYHLISVATFPDRYLVNHRFVMGKVRMCDYPHSGLTSALSPSEWSTDSPQTSVWVPLRILQDVFLPEAVDQLVMPSGGVVYV